MPFDPTETDATVLSFPREASAVPEPAASLLPVLIVLHQETSSPGRVGNALRALGTGWISGVRGLAIRCRKRWTIMPAR